MWTYCDFALSHCFHAFFILFSHRFHGPPLHPLTFISIFSICLENSWKWDREYQLPFTGQYLYTLAVGVLPFAIGCCPAAVCKLTCSSCLGFAKECVFMVLSRFVSCCFMGTEIREYALFQYGSVRLRSLPFPRKLRVVRKVSVLPQECPYMSTKRILVSNRVGARILPMLVRGCCCR